MRLDKFVKVNNVLTLSLALNAVANRDAGTPGMVLLHAPSGYGKTRTTAYLVNKHNALYIRAFSTWTVTAMLEKILRELRADSPRTAAKQTYLAIKLLTENNRALFVDEADYLLYDRRMIETLRDIHDMSGMPVLMVGMSGIERRIVLREQLARRIAQWVEFRPLELTDAARFVAEVCETMVEDDLLKHVLDETKGNLGKIIVALTRIESIAKDFGWPSVSRKQWGKRQLFLTHEQSTGPAAQKLPEETNKRPPDDEKKDPAVQDSQPPLEKNHEEQVGTSENREEEGTLPEDQKAA